MEVFEAFKPVKKDTPVDRLDPRTRFAISVTLAALSVYSSSALVQVIVLASVFVVATLARRCRLLVKGAVGSLPLLLMIFLLNFVFAPTPQGALTSFAMALRFLALMSAFSVFFMTTPPEELALSLEEIGVPRDYSLLITMSFRFVPTLATDVQLVMDALRSRGLELERGKLRARIKNYVYLLVPLIVFEVRRSMMIAEALESRGYGSGVKPTRLVRLRFSYLDLLALTVLMFFVAMLRIAGLV